LERTGEIGAFQVFGESESGFSTRPPLKQALGAGNNNGYIASFIDEMTRTV